MNQTDTVELAIQAGILFRRNVFYSEYCDGVDIRDLVVFATLLAQYEREECARIADEWVLAYPHPSKSIAELIRKRKKK